MTGGAMRKILCPVVLTGVILLELILAFLLSLTELNAIMVTLVVDLVFAIGAGIWYRFHQSEVRPSVSTRQFLFFLAIQVPIWLMSQVTATYIISLDSNAYFSESLENAPVLLYLLLTLCIAPITEELLFRGLWYKHLRDAFGVFPAAIVSSLVFSVLHGNLPQMYVTVVMGLFYALCMELTDRIWIVMILHAVANMMDALAVLIRIPTFFLEPWFFGPIDAVIIGVLLILLYKHRRHAVPVQKAPPVIRTVLPDAHEGVYEKQELDESESNMSLK